MKTLAAFVQWHAHRLGFKNALFEKGP
jgi:hypothetical protein